jgi:hypothetical protein
VKREDAGLRPWESKEKADAREALFNHEITETTHQLQETAELLSSLRMEVPTEKQHESDHEAEEERRLESLEGEHPRR